ncbi:hypothetical protein NKI51_11630 [Mesorhizobium australicum]|uniref:hypothetical protein n=1 Tax=Mesorhizobium australicum TaxID=536018 RepID=UPI00333C85D9
MGIFSKLWRDFVTGFREGQKIEKAKQVESQDDAEIRRLATTWGQGTTPAEKEAAGRAAMRYILDNPGGKPGGAGTPDN